MDCYASKGGEGLLRVPNGWHNVFPLFPIWISDCLFGAFVNPWVTLATFFGWLLSTLGWTLITLIFGNKFGFLFRFGLWCREIRFFATICDVDFRQICDVVFRQILESVSSGDLNIGCRLGIQNLLFLQIPTSVVVTWKLLVDWAFTICFSYNNQLADAFWHSYSGALNTGNWAFKICFSYNINSTGWRHLAQLLWILRQVLCFWGSFNNPDNTW